MVILVIIFLNIYKNLINNVNKNVINSVTKIMIPSLDFSSGSVPKASAEFYPSPLSGKVRAGPLSPSTRASLSTKQGFIYGIFDRRDESWYVGKTEQELVDRIKQHVSKANEAKEEATFLYHELGKRPRDFEYRVLEATDKENLGNEEKRYIKELFAYSAGYNRTRGGNGGKAVRDRVDEWASLQSSPQISLIMRQAATTPTKYYPLERRLNGKVFVRLTPSARSHGKAVNYRIRTDEGRYEGRTGNFPRRLRSHVYESNHPERRQKTLHQVMFSHPESCRVGLLPKPLSSSQGTPEIALIEACAIRRSRGSSLNGNRGLDFEKLRRSGKRLKRLFEEAAQEEASQ